MLHGRFFQKGVGDPNQRRFFGPSFGALICAPRLPVFSSECQVWKKRLFFCKLFQTINKKSPLQGLQSSGRVGIIISGLVNDSSFPCCVLFAAERGESQLPYPI